MLVLDLDTPFENGWGLDSLYSNLSSFPLSSSTRYGGGLHGKSRPTKPSKGRAKAKTTKDKDNKQDSKSGKRRNIDTDEYSWQTTVRDFVDLPSFGSITNSRSIDRNCFDQFYLHCKSPSSGNRI